VTAPASAASDGSTAAESAAAPTLLAMTAQPRLLLQATPDARSAESAGGGFISVMDFEWVLAPRGSAIDIRLPNETFVHRDRDAELALSVSLSSDQPLPAWLRFDPRERRFTGTAPAGVGRSMVIRITARDAHGAQASTLLPLMFSN